MVDTCCIYSTQCSFVVVSLRTIDSGCYYKGFVGRKYNVEERDPVQCSLFSPP